MSGSLKPTYLPFSAVLGMEDAKKALMCPLADPSIRAILIRGNSGTGKTALARSVGSISGKTIVNVPLNVTDEQLLGCLDMEAAISTGCIVMQEGLLQKANGNILYMDDINLFDNRLLSIVLESVASKRVKVEREGLSAEYSCDTLLIATMNLDNAYLNPGVLDRFDICVDVDFPTDTDDRIEIIERNVSYGDDPDAFAELYSEKDAEIKERIAKAKSIVDSSVPNEDVLRMVASVCQLMKVKGMRGDISMIRVMTALAALDGRDVCSADDAELAARMCLIHRQEVKKGRRTDNKKKQYTKMESGESQCMRWLSHETGKKEYFDETGALKDLPTEEVSVNDVPDADLEPVSGLVYAEIEDVVSKIGETFETVDLFEDNKTRRGRGEAGKRNTGKSSNRSGRYIGSRITDEKNPDLAFDATVRVAAPYQKMRHEKDPDSDVSIIIEKHDMREKIREVRTTATFLFAVDTSGSLIIRNRMMAVKGAILSLLKGHYAKRDRVGFLSFNSEGIKLTLPPTRSVECVYRIIDELPIGKKTPLAAALIYLQEYMTVFSKKHSGEDCYVILVTDGKANVCLDPEDKTTDAREEALGIAKKMNVPGLHWIVVDSGTLYEENPPAKKLADALKADYYTIEDLKLDDAPITTTSNYKTFRSI